MSQTSRDESIPSRTIVITGASSGIGRTAAYYCRDKWGLRVMATARRERDCEALRREGFEAILLDLDSSTSIQQAVKTIRERLDGPLYALFNNAGYGHYGALKTLSREDFEAQFSSNLFGHHQLTMALLPLMEPFGEGRLIQTSSVMGFVTSPERGLYAASKYALEAWSDTLRLELHGSGIGVALLEPGPLATQFSQNRLQSGERAVENPPIARFFTLTAEALMPKLHHALFAKRCRPRYRVTLISHGMWFLKRWMPTAIVDWLLRRHR